MNFWLAEEQLGIAVAVEIGGHVDHPLVELVESIFHGDRPRWGGEETRSIAEEQGDKRSP